MSKIGKINISIPEKVKVALAGNILNIEGPFGKKSLDIDSQIITLRALDLSPKSQNFWIKSIRGAKLIVEKKTNQTRISVIDIYSIPKFYFTLTWFFGIEKSVTPKYIEEKYLFKRNLRKKFINKDAKIIEAFLVSMELRFLTFKIKPYLVNSVILRKRQVFYVEFFTDISGEVFGILIILKTFKVN